MISPNFFPIRRLRRRYLPPLLLLSLFTLLLIHSSYRSPPPYTRPALIRPFRLRPILPTISTSSITPPSTFITLNTSPQYRYASFELLSRGSTSPPIAPEFIGYYNAHKHSSDPNDAESGEGGVVLTKDGPLWLASTGTVPEYAVHLGRFDKGDEVGWHGWNVEGMEDGEGGVVEVLRYGGEGGWIACRTSSRNDEEDTKNGMEKEDGERWAVFYGNKPDGAGEGKCTEKFEVEVVYF